MILPVDKVLLNHLMHWNLKIENWDPSFGKLSVSLAFTDPGTVLDDFLVNDFMQLHIFPGDIESWILGARTLYHRTVYHRTLYHGHFTTGTLYHAAI